MMSAPKPVRMWALTHASDKKLSVWNIRATRVDAIAYAETVTDEPWRKLRMAGYRCIPVTITPDTPCTCGICWTFEDGTPDENKVNFCPRCGARRVTLTPDPESEK